MYEDTEGVEPVCPLVRRVPICFNQWVREARKISRRSQGQGREEVYSAGTGRPGEDLSMKETAKLLQKRFFAYLNDLVESEYF